MDDTTFADFWLVNTIAGSNELDFPKSCYFNKERGGRLKAGPFWNFDYEIFKPDYTLVRKDLLYYPNLFKNSEFTALVKERWAELQPKFLALTNFIGEQMELLSEAGALNDVLWPEISVNPNGERNSRRTRLKETFLERLKVLDAEISGWRRAKNCTCQDSGTETLRGFYWFLIREERGTRESVLHSGTLAYAGIGIRQFPTWALRVSENWGSLFPGSDFCSFRESPFPVSTP